MTDNLTDPEIKLKVKNLKIELFNSIEDVYKFIEENAYHLERNWDLTDLFVKFRNHTKSDDEKQKAQWEIECFMFDFKGARIFSFSYSTGKNIGEVKKYPELDEFQKEAFEYLKSRISNTKNDLLLARYNHLLWKGLSGIKNRVYAIKSINSYINSIKQFYELYNRDKNKENPYQIGRLYETLVGLCNEVNAGIDEVKDLTKFVLFEAKGIEFYSKHGIIDDMLAHPKLFKQRDFTDTLLIFEQELKREKSKSDDFMLVNYHLPTAIKVAQKCKLDVKKWHDEMGFAYLRMAEKETEDDRIWLKQNAYAKAIQSFTLSGNGEKKKETEQLYFELKPKVKLDNVRIDFDEETVKKLKEFQDYIKNVAENLLKAEPFEIYSAIANGLFFPKYSDVLTASQNNKNAFLDFVTTIQFDKNKNITQPAKEEDNNEKLYTTYSYQINNSVLPFLHYIFIPGIKSGHLTFENFLSFLLEKSWIGQPHTTIDLGGEENEVNWVQILTPAIVEYFVQVQSWVSSKYYLPSFVLCIDSLTLKVEGLLRNFSERANISTSVGRAKGMQEAYIHNVLDNETIKKYFNEDDLLFFNYLFANEGGLNIRNNVAHCFYSYNEYSSDKMLLLIAALLRIAKYNYKSSTGRTEPNS